MAGPPEYVSVAVVGAGLAGLYAAQQLRKTFPDVIVLEAQDRVGGRVRQVHGLAPWPVEAGPEFVHGSKSKFSEVVKDFGLDFVEKDWPDYWYFGKERQLVNDEQVDDEVDKVHDLFDSVGDLDMPEQDMSAAQWLRSQGATEKQMAVADVCYANDFGCSIHQLGLKEMIVENQRWDSGETYLIMQQPMSAVVERLAQGLRIRTGWPVTSITYDAGGAVLTGPGGARVAARKVVVTAPLKVLQSGRIRFQPPLPSAKLAAIQRLRMGNAVKVLVSFNKRFWPRDLYDVVCTDCFVPEFWMTQRNVTDPSCQGLFAVTGFIAGERADALKDVPADEAVKRFVDQLDAIFGTPADPKPATASYVRSLVFDWSKEPYVGAAYTYPTLGAELGDRSALGAPVLGTLFFAGEACHTGVNPCMQAALETGEQAAEQVAAALQPVQSRL